MDELVDAKSLNSKTKEKKTKMESKMVRSKCSSWADVTQGRDDVTQGRDDDSDQETVQSMEILLLSWVVKYSQKMLVTL